MSVQVSLAVVTGLLGLVSAGVLALINSGITARAGIDEELRAKRLAVYPVVWETSGAVSRWPRQDGSRAAVADLSVTLRSWYYEVGGLFLSETARARYGDVQELIETLLNRAADSADTLTPNRYQDLMETVSAFRAALTQDLDTRRRRSRLESRRRSRWHEVARQGALDRISLAAKDAQPFTAIGSTSPR